MKIRIAKLKDLGQIIEILTYAKNMMIKHKNPKQWTGESYIGEEMLGDEIKRKEIFILESSQSLLCVFGLRNSNEIYNNSSLKWLNDEPFLEISRFACAPQETHEEISNMNIVKFVLSFCERKTKNLRADTGVANKEVQYMLTKNGFKFVGELKNPFKEYGDHGDFYFYHKVLRKG